MTRLALVLVWAIFVLATNRWMSWERPIALRIDTDVLSYEKIARAAPSLPDERMRTVLAQRFPVHWVVGVISDATGIGLHAVYRILAIAILGCVAFVVDRIFGFLDLGLPLYGVLIGALVSSPYVFRFAVLAPGMLADAAFVAGTSLLLFGLVRRRSLPVAGGLVVSIARQTGLVLPIGALLWIVLDPTWRSRSRAGRAVLAGVSVVAPIGLFLVVRHVADAFSVHDVPTPSDITVWPLIAALPSHGKALAEHVARVVIGLPIPLALLLGGVVAAVRTGRASLIPFAAWGSLILAALIVGQPLVLNPDWVVHNETRLAALAIVPVLVAAAFVLNELPGRHRLGPIDVGTLYAAVALASLHHRYTVAGPPETPAVFVALEFAASLAAFWVLAQRLPASGIGADGGRPAT